MGKWLCGVSVALLLGVVVPQPGQAAGCVNGVYRAGCAGPNGAVGVRKAPIYRRPVAVAPRPPVVVARPPPAVVVVPPPRPVVVVPAG